MGNGVARLRVGDEGFRARRLPVHRPAEFPGADQHRDIFRIDRGLHAEGAADILGDDAQLVVRHAHDGGRHVAQRIGALRAGIERVAVGRLVIDAGRAARFHRRHHHALIGDRHLGDMRRLGDQARDLALVVVARHRTGPVDAEITGHFGIELGLALHRGVEIDHRRQFLVVDLHEIGGVLRLCGRLSHHHRHRVAAMHDLVAA